MQFDYSRGTDRGDEKRYVELIGRLSSTESIERSLNESEESEETTSGDQKRAERDNESLEGQEDEEEFVNKLVKKRDLALEYLSLYKKPADLMQSELAIKCVRSLAHNIHYYYEHFLPRDYAAAILEKNYDQMMLDLLAYFYESIVQVAIRIKSGESLETMEIDYELRLKVARHTTSLMLTCSNYLHQFSLSIVAKNGVEILLQYVTHPVIIDLVTDRIYPVSRWIKKALNELIYSSLGTLHNISNTIAKTRQKWTELNAASRLMNLTDRFENKENLRTTTYLIIANIATDEEISTLPNINVVLKTLCLIFENFADSLSGNDEIIRATIQPECDEDSKVDVIQICYNSYLWHLIEIIEAIYHMAINDAIKYEIYMENKMGEYLRTVIYRGNNIEVEYSLKLLWQLCFDQRIAQHVREDEELMEKIRLIKSTPECSERLSKMCRGIQWQIKKRKKRSDSKSDFKLSDSSKLAVENGVQHETSVHVEEQKLIMISYNRESRDICLKVKSELEAMGFKVWIDVESIHGSSLESMAEAIETSFCVLMCMTEKYKQSPNCRAEAEYTFQLGKPIIPLIMQANYKPDGWLGIILGSKIFIPFMKYDFEECMRRLNEELRSLSNRSANKPNGIKSLDDSFSKIANSSGSTGSALIPHETSNQLNNSIKGARVETEWSDKDVEKWFVEKNLNYSILKQLRPCDGKLLKQVLTILNTAPEYSFRIMSERGGLSVGLRDVAMFNYELKELFKT